MDLSVVPYGEEARRAAAFAAASPPADPDPCVPGRYRECMRNHAAAIGGQAYDGCGEFMPAGVDGTLEALKCAACGCHRNFHRRDGCGSSHRPLLLAPPPPAGYPATAFLTPPLLAPYHQIRPPMSAGAYDGGRAGSETPPRREEEAGGRKRYRTRFTAEQKEKMQAFAEKLGWRVQKHDDAALEEFCVEVGVKRHVLKVWMHNNKQALSSSAASKHDGGGGGAVPASAPAIRV